MSRQMFRDTFILEIKALVNTPWNTKGMTVDRAIDYLAEKMGIQLQGEESCRRSA